MPSTIVRRLLGAAALLIVAGLAAAAPVRAQPALPVPTIIIVDLPQMLREAKAAKGIQGQLNQQTVAYSKEVAKQEDELQKMRAELERQRTILAPEAFTTKSKEFQQRYEELDRSVQGKRQGLQQVYNEAMTKVEGAALQIIADIAKERKANLVVAKQAILFEADGLDVTAEALTRLDQKLPAVAVSPPKPDAEGGTAKAKPAPAPAPSKR